MGVTSYGVPASYLGCNDGYMGTSWEWGFGSEDSVASVIQGWAGFYAGPLVVTLWVPGRVEEGKV